MNRTCLSNDTRTNSLKSWTSVYAGFFLILLCFFVMLCSYSVTDNSKVSKVITSFSKTSSILTGEQRCESSESALQVTPEMANIDSELAGIYTDIMEITKTLGMETDIKLSVSERGVILKLSDKIMFLSGKSDILPEAKSLIEKMVKIIAPHPAYHIRVEGHTDNTPIFTSRFPSNWELSTSRAVNVIRYILELGKMNAERLSAAGFGEYRPIFTNDTQENKSRNRRVEIFFYKKEMKMVVQ